MISQSESYAISLVRFIAMVLIVSCHILQSLDNGLAYVLNIGVQMFLAISGYLYGQKIINNWGVWFGKRIMKVYLPFIVFFAICMLLYLFVQPEAIDVVRVTFHVFNLQGLLTRGIISGLGHLWFLSAIMLCYLITPVLQCIKKSPPPPELNGCPAYRQLYCKCAASER